MNKYYLILPLLIVLGMTGLSHAQFVPPKLSPGCNPTDPNCNIAPPLNTSGQYQIKNSNLAVRLPNNGIGTRNPNWIPNIFPGGVASPYAFDTNAWLRAWDIRSNSITVGTIGLNNNTTNGNSNLFLPGIAETTTAIDTEKPLCIVKGTGFVKRCGSSSGNTSSKPVITFTVRINGQIRSGTPNGTTFENYDFKDIPGFRTGQSTPQAIVSWQTSDADRCWSNSDMGGMIAGQDLKNGNYTELFNGIKDVTISCENDATGTTSSKTARVSLNYYGGRQSTIRLATEYTSGTANFRWRENTNPVNVNYAVTSPDTAPVWCRKKVVAYEHAETEGGLRSPLPFAGTTLSDYWSPWERFTTNEPNNGSSDPSFGTSSNYTCTQFFKSGCIHNNEGARTADLYVQCYNNQNGQTMENPAQAHARLQWINPD